MTQTQEISVTFNPTGLPADQIYRRDIPLHPNPAISNGFRSLSELAPPEDQNTPLSVYRLELTERVASGVGMIASSVLLEGGLGDTSQFVMNKHLSSSYEDRQEPGKRTPFVSVSSNPGHLARTLIGTHGFGIKPGQDSVVVSARMDPARLVGGAYGKKEELLAVGGIAPEEFAGVQTAADFMRSQVGPDEIIPVRDKGTTLTMKRDKAIAYWQSRPVRTHEEARAAYEEALQQRSKLTEQPAPNLDDFDPID